MPLLSSVRLMKKQAAPSSSDMLTSDAFPPALGERRKTHPATNEVRQTRGLAPGVKRL